VKRKVVWAMPIAQRTAGWVDGGVVAEGMRNHHCNLMAEGLVFLIDRVHVLQEVAAWKLAIEKTSAAKESRKTNTVRLLLQTCWRHYVGGEACRNYLAFQSQN
jgi:hypothetical protein